MLDDGVTTSLLPKLPPHRPSAAVKAVYQDKVEAFCTKLQEVRSRLDFDVGSRGWAYVLEGDRLIDKDEIDAAQNLINACRKNGNLPVAFCSEDDKRAAENLEYIDSDPQEKAAELFDDIQRAEEDYTPFSFWDDLNTYVQVGTEKSNVKNLFTKTCAGLYVPIANLGGWADLNVRAGFMQRFKEKEAEGKQCVLLLFTDHDPGGLHIADKLRSNLDDLADADGVKWHPRNLIIERFGLDADFIDRHGLVWIENLVTAKGEYPLNDRRHNDHFKPYVQDYLRKYGVRKVEADALLKVPEIGRELCRQAILKYVPANAPRRYRNKLKPVRIKLRRELDRLFEEWAT
jgi:hypothetical protein